MGDIRLGTSGYSFSDWKGEVYPANIKDSEMFDYYVNQFRLNTVELNFTYYKMPTARAFESYSKKSPDGFDFTVKLFNGITHEPWLNASNSSVDNRLCDRFLEGIYPLTEAGKIGCLLAQFPPHMRPSEQSWDYLLSLRDALKFEHNLVFEFRNKEWISTDTIETLRREEIGFCAVDEPQIGPLMPLVPAVTSDIAYLRLHGRNKKWFKDKTVRYDYLYSEQELTEFLPTVEQMAAKSETIYIQFNNCHVGSALRNVKTMQYLLGLDLPPMQGVLF